MTDKHVPEDELEEQRPDLLPNREAMSLVAADPAQYAAGVEGLVASTPAEGAGAGAADTATDASNLASTQVSASGSGEESVTSEDRSEQLSASDSAYSET